jgi:hypothetical protein
MVRCGSSLFQDLDVPAAFLRYTAQHALEFVSVDTPGAAAGDQDAVLFK